MLIIKKFHDYYDSISVYGIDKEYVYNRVEKVLKGTLTTGRKYRDRWPHSDTYSKTKAGKTTEFTVHKRVIGFCGNLYPVIYIVKKPKTGKSEAFSFYSTKKVLDFVAKEKLDGDFKKYNYWSAMDYSIESEKTLDNFFAGADFKELKEEFQKHKVPVFVYGRFENDEKLVLNPKLKDYRFMQVKDPPTAFQDIYMFLSGVLGVSFRPMVEISDKEMAKKKGHDSKYSFRKPPGKRGNPRWR